MYGITHNYLNTEEAHMHSAASLVAAKPGLALGEIIEQFSTNDSARSTLEAI